VFPFHIWSRNPWAPASAIPRWVCASAEITLLQFLPRRDSNTGGTLDAAIQGDGNSFLVHSSDKGTPISPRWKLSHVTGCKNL